MIQAFITLQKSNIPFSAAKTTNCVTRLNLGLMFTFLDYFFSVLNVACDVNLLTITISKSSVGPAVKQLYVGQRIEGCTFDVDANADTTLSIQVDTCGTRRWTLGNYLFYNNVVYGNAESDGGLPIVHSEDVAFNATCVFDRIINVTAAFLPNANFTLSTTGNKVDL